MKTLAFVHGWGFDAHFWRPVADRLPEFARIFVDLGFRAEAVRPGANNPIIIGHSMGFAWALAGFPRPWAGAVAVNAFPRFTRAQDFVAGTPPRSLDRMIERFATHPHEVTADFMQRCGIDAADTETIRPAPMAEALKWLAECDERQTMAQLDCPLLALAGTRDLVVPEAMSRDSFPPQCLTLVEGAGHLLPWTHPDWVASQIRLFASTIP
ncbi:alpha/beta fold hydrolase [Magnetospirillum gryphiswaldense]|uniref:alpha/beta fold hydrolase n=1 Tax=Magnetospirillum gryphiswaldense TaxID=55518 RepID=UPI000D038ECE|nr:alpha/beta hydrolase [Magnetospirillum gryphiswaldense]AVM73819.1 Pimeloyl-[acyl-carrier protein] methyl ester esterase [Magnetospirillum gryphiswaldense MSR-1]AVM77722.1 Pimeloyl-[acyl-carrier protein] methyl ester esterase [Magnetospirillum gryphiswaldense]